MLIVFNKYEHYDGIVRNPTTGGDSVHCVNSTSDKSIAIYKKRMVSGDYSDASNIRILPWNINDLRQEKLDDEMLGSMLRAYDIILVGETWAPADDNLELQNLSYYN